MPSVTRSIRIEAPPEVVRRFLDDPVWRRGWLDEEIELAPTEDGGRRFRDEDAEVPRYVRIDVDGDGPDGTRVTVTESLGEPPAADGDGEVVASVVPLRRLGIDRSPATEHEDLTSWTGRIRYQATGEPPVLRAA